MAKLFISYAREDRKFATRFRDELDAHGHEVWIDLEEMPPAAEWRDEIARAIDSSEVFLFVISLHSAASRPCRDELEQAVERSKKIVPLALLDVEVESLPDALEKLNWVFFRSDDEFAGGLNEVLKAIVTDLDYVREHTRLLVRALEWKRTGHSFLGGKELGGAQAWLAASGQREPPPVALHHDFVRASRRVQRRRRTILGSIGLVSLVAIVVLGILIGEESRKRAREREISDSLQWASRAQAAGENRELALSFALEAVRMEDPPLRSQRVLAETAYAPGPRPDVQGPVGDTVFAMDGDGRLLADTRDGVPVRWEIPDGTRLEENVEEAGAGRVFLAWSSEPRTGEKRVLRTPDGKVSIELTRKPASPPARGPLRILDRYRSEWEVALTITPPPAERAEDAFVLRRPPVEAQFTPDSRFVLFRAPAIRLRADMLPGGLRNLWILDLQSGTLRSFGTRPEFSAMAVGPIEDDFPGSGSTVLFATGTLDGRLAVHNFLYQDRLADVTSLELGLGPVRGISFSAGRARVAAAWSDGTAFVWHLAREVEAEQEVGGIRRKLVVDRSLRLDGRLSHLTLTPDGTRLVFPRGDGLRVWDLEHGAITHFFRSGCAAVGFADDGTTVHCIGETGIHTAHDLVAGSSKQLRGERFEEGVSPVVMACGGRTVGIGEREEDDDEDDEDAERYGWIDRGGPVGGTIPVDGPGDPRRAIAIALSFGGENLALLYPDGRLLVQSSEGELVESPDRVDSATVRCLAVDPTGKVVAAGHTDGSVSVWRVHEQHLGRVDLRAGAVEQLAISASGRVIWQSGDRLHLWSLDGSGELVEVNEPIGSLVSLRIGPAGRHAVAGHGTLLTVVELASGLVVRQFPAGSELLSVGWSSDGRRLVSGHRDGMVRVWRMDSLEELVTWIRKNRSVEPAGTPGAREDQ